MSKLNTNYIGLIEKLDKALETAIDRVLKYGCYEDVQDEDSKGGTKTSRLANTTGINDLRLLRTSLVQEFNQLGSGAKNTDSYTPNLLTLIQSGLVTCEDLNDL